MSTSQKVSSWTIVNLKCNFFKISLLFKEPHLYTFCDQYVKNPPNSYEKSIAFVIVFTDDWKHETPSLKILIKC